MIGIGAVASGLLAAAVVAGLLPGDAGPGPGLAADRLVRDRAERAADTLEALDAALVPALDAARRGAARIVAGATPPAEELREAGAITLAAEPLAGEATSALEDLAAARTSREPGASSPDAPVTPGTLTSIAGQLTATADAGDAFATMRRRADAVTERLAEALAALEAGQLETADRLVSEARADHDELRDWEVGLVTLPVWIGTTDAMIGAMEAILNATRSGDPDAARDAALAFGELEGEAAVADRALRIAMAEGGAAVGAVALGRLADALGAVRDARNEVESLLAMEAR